MGIDQQPRMNTDRHGCGEEYSSPTGTGWSSCSPWSLYPLSPYAGEGKTLLTYKDMCRILVVRVGRRWAVRVRGQGYGSAIVHGASMLSSRVSSRRPDERLEPALAPAPWLRAAQRSRRSAYR